VPAAAAVAAGTPDTASNLRACRNRQPECDRSLLTLSEVSDLARADHARNVTDCRNAVAACDRSSFGLAEVMKAYDTFGNAARERALKVVLHSA